MDVNKPTIQRGLESIRNWSTENKAEFVGISAQAGHGTGLKIEVNSIDKQGVLHDAKLDINPREDARILLQTINEVVQLNLELTETNMREAEEQIVPINVSWAAPHARDIPQNKTSGQTYVEETDRDGWVYRSNLRMHGKKDPDSSFNLKRSLKESLAKTFNTSPSEVKVSGRSGHWDISIKDAPNIKIKWDNDGNMVALSTRDTQAESISIHSIQGGGGNANIVVTDQDGHVHVYNTEAFGESIDSLPQELKDRTLLIHGDRENRRIEKWTAGGNNDELSGVKASLVHLRKLNDEKLGAVAEALKIRLEDLKSSPLLKTDDDTLASIDDQNKWITNQAKDGDTLARALEEDLMRLTLEVIAPKIKAIQENFHGHKVTQFTYHGGSIASRMKKLDLFSMTQDWFKSRGFNIPLNRIKKHEPELDGARDITHTELKKSLHASHPFAKVQAPDSGDY